ncbi:11125_t:CDS:2 [Acaulospora morrowiae]|uniref:11125_t:CDS:1 n=1 Tax=Acaulospora morrowiae TaxID=94023 RepID=A0A9N9BW10_9GLOM|nr:11125_t:CDS:2 [Acaulospora morrowiae]
MSKNLGELVVVAIKGRNLTSSGIGKADPFVTFRIGDTARRTKADKRGGQNPNWDDEVRFQLKDESSNKKMKVQVYIEDKREHDLIGETVIDLKNVLEKGEVDEWFEVKFRNKYAGEVFLEMTFYSAGEPPPVSANQRIHPVAPTTIHQTQSPPYKPPSSNYPPTTPISNNASAPYPPPHNYPPNNPVLSPPLQSSKLPPVQQYPPVSQPYPPVSQVNSTPYPPVSQANSTPYPPFSTQYPPVSQGYPLTPSSQMSTSPQGAMSFPVPTPTPSGAPHTGGYPSFSGYPNYNYTPPPPSIGNDGMYQQQPPYPPGDSHVHPPTSNPNFYPPTSNSNNIYPPNNANVYPSNNTNVYPPNNANVYPPNNANVYPPNNTNVYPPTNNNVYPPPSGQGYHQSSYGPGHSYPY